MNFLKTILMLSENLKTLEYFTAKVENEFSFKLFNSSLIETIKNDIFRFEHIYHKFNADYMFLLIILTIIPIPFTFIIFNPKFAFIISLFLLLILFKIFHLDFKISQLIKLISRIKHGLTPVENSISDLKQLISWQEEYPKLVNDFRDEVLKQGTAFNNFHFEELKNRLTSSLIDSQREEVNQLLNKFKSS